MALDKGDIETIAQIVQQTLAAQQSNIIIPGEERSIPDLSVNWLAALWREGVHKFSVVLDEKEPRILYEVRRRDGGSFPLKLGFDHGQEVIDVLAEGIAQIPAGALMFNPNDVGQQEQKLTDPELNRMREKILRAQGF